MECTKCKKRKGLEDYSYKNKKDKIYYNYCNQCREKSNIEKEKYKDIAKENYDILKKTNVIKCDCGKSYVSFRTYHIYRHNNSKYHLEHI
jgi:hypothetical protein